MSKKAVCTERDPKLLIEWTFNFKTNLFEDTELSPELVAFILDAFDRAEDKGSIITAWDASYEWDAAVPRPGNTEGQ